MLLAMMSHETLPLCFLVPEQNTYTDPKACLLQKAFEYIRFPKCGANLARQSGLAKSVVDYVIVIVFGYIIKKTL